jgi:iron complex outermembrane receptor protein
VGLSTDYNGLATKGSFHVNEGYAELIIPVASKQPFIDELELQAAARIFNYNTFGTDSIYKFEGRYRPVRDFTVRGTFSTGFRAPGISDLYSGTQPNFPSAKDPCAKLTAGSVLEAQCKASAVGSIAANNGDPNSQIASTVGGNPLLKPETATTATLGVVFEPQFFKGFSATVDFWNVSLEQSLSTIGTAVIVAGCYPGADKSGAAITPNATYCGLITRSPLTGQITDVKDLEQNVGKEARQGLDFAARYQFPAASYGKIGVQADLTYLLTYDTTLATGKVIHGAGNYDLGLAPKVKANVGVSYAMDAFSAFLRARIVGGFTECADSSGGNTSSTGCTDQNTYAPDKTAPTVVVPYPTHEVPAQVTFDLSLSYKLKNPLGVTTFSAGVRNLLDSAPPTVYNSFLSYADTGYDFMGRFIYFRLGQQF